MKIITPIDVQRNFMNQRRLATRLKSFLSNKYYNYNKILLIATIYSRKLCPLEQQEMVKIARIIPPNN